MADSQSQATAPRAWSVRMADSVLQQHPILGIKWDYDWGVTLKGIESVGVKTGDAKYYDYIKTDIDHFVQPDGASRAIRSKNTTSTKSTLASSCSRCIAQTGDEKYKKAASLLREQLSGQPRTSEGGFWHKKIYPYQMWLDGIYMASPFYAEFGKTFGEPAAFDDVAHQIILIEKHTRDAKTGLLYHGWDESKQQRWANPETGCSPHFWGRAVGWYAMAIVDVLDYLPPDHPKRPDILAIFERMMAALVKVQDQSTGLWYQVLDQGNREGNYLEASGSCMFVYSIAKAVRQGYLCQGQPGRGAQRLSGHPGHLIRVDEQGLVNLEKTCGVAGLGGTPYRDGSYEYYVGEQRLVTNDITKALARSSLASVEMEH